MEKYSFNTVMKIVLQRIEEKRDWHSCILYYLNTIYGFSPMCVDIWKKDWYVEYKFLGVCRYVEFVLNNYTNSQIKKIILGEIIIPELKYI